MKQVRLAAEALEDLKHIWDFLAEDSFAAADTVLDDFEDAFGNLARMSGMGHRREDLTQQNVLFWPVHSYLIIYEVASEIVHIVAILHGKRNINKILKTR